MKRTTIIILAIIFLFNCKEEKNIEPQIQVTETPKEADKLTLEIELASNKPDKMQMLFALIELDNGRNGMYVIDDKFKEPSEKQILKFSMFDDLIPFVVQLKLGPTPKNIIIDKILVKYGDQEVYIEGKDLDKYFSLSEYVTFDANTGSLTTFEKNGKSLPQITLRRGYINKLFNLQ